MNKEELETWQLEVEAELAFHNTQVMLEKRWKEMGRQEERERIIKLLEELIAKPTYQLPMEYWVQCKLVEQAIALIKGENK